MVVCQIHKRVPFVIRAAKVKAILTLVRRVGKRMCHNIWLETSAGNRWLIASCRMHYPATRSALTCWWNYPARLCWWWLLGPKTQSVLAGGCTWKLPQGCACLLLKSRAAFSQAETCENICCNLHSSPSCHDMLALKRSAMRVDLFWVLFCQIILIFVFNLLEAIIWWLFLFLTVWKLPKHIMFSSDILINFRY